jgi:hypothetical protein
MCGFRSLRRYFVVVDPQQTPTLYLCASRRLTAREAIHTPPEFRDVLLQIARSAWVKV